MVHQKCRSKFYLFTTIARIILTDEQVPWSYHLSNYNPTDYTLPTLKNKSYADPDVADKNFQPKFNELDGQIDRSSHFGPYQIVNGRPLNPEGRTGLAGRGVLGRWGPNHAADPIVTRWKQLNGQKVLHPKSSLPILQFCAIQRKDCGEWALPGGMVDPDELITQTLRREFSEEALNSRIHPDCLDEFFGNGLEIYRGYVDDPRNTDNAWMETVAHNFHDPDDTHVGRLQLEAGDDAGSVRWMDIDGSIDLYANHRLFLEKVAQLRQAHW